MPRPVRDAGKCRTDAWKRVGRAPEPAARIRGLGLMQPGGRCWTDADYFTTGWNEASGREEEGKRERLAETMRGSRTATSNEKCLSQSRPEAHKVSMTLDRADGSPL